MSKLSSSPSYMREGYTSLESSTPMVNMHEQDAEILERGVDKSSSSVSLTPITYPEESIYTSSPPSMTLGEQIVNDDDKDHSCQRSSCVVPDGESYGVFDSFDSATSDASLDDKSEGPQDIHLEKQSLYHSFERISLNDHKHDIPNTNTVQQHVSVNDSTCTNVSLSASAATANESNKRDSLERKLSDRDRRIREAAQFAKAVGETPPKSEHEIMQVIIEDASSSDEDDDDNDGPDEDFENGKQSQHYPESISDTIQSNISNCETNDTTANHTHQYTEPQDFRNPVHGSRYDTNPLSSTNHNNDPDTCSKDFMKNSISINGVNELLPDTNKIHTENFHFDTKQSRHQQQQPSKQLSMQRSHSELQMIANKGENIKLYCRRPRSYSHTAFDNYIPIKDKTILGDGEITSTQQFKYRGIKHNPPEITKRGLSRGNHAQLHRKAWLEVSDIHHRYGKNLRLYYNHWESLGHPANMFFDWLDSKNEASGWDLPDLAECPRDKLDSDTVLYITDIDEQNEYRIYIKTPKKKKDLKSDERGSPGQIVDSEGNIVRTGPNGWIFVLRDHELYGAKKVISCGKGKSKQRFHHSSFFGGKAVASAGILITDDSGYLKLMFPHSGHYRPGEAHMQRLLYHVHESGVDLTTFDVDMQQIMHVSREKRDETTPKGGGGDSGEKMKKSKKMDSLHLANAFWVALFLGQKAQLIGNGLLSQLHKIRTIEIEKRTVVNMLDVIDDGGIWK